MGDHRMLEIKLTDGSLYLYTHWHGYELPDLVRAAVEQAKPRLGDEPYWTRIIIDQITKSARDKKTGFGIMLRPNADDAYNGGQPSIVLDAQTGKVKVILRSDR